MQSFSLDRRLESSLALSNRWELDSVPYRRFCVSDLGRSLPTRRVEPLIVPGIAVCP